MGTVIAIKHDILRTALATALETGDIEILGQAASGDEVINLCREIDPSDVIVVIIDDRLPDMTGTDCLKNILSTGKPIRSILLTIHPDQPEVDAKATGFDIVYPYGISLKDMITTIQSFHVQRDHNP